MATLKEIMDRVQSGDVLLSDAEQLQDYISQMAIKHQSEKQNLFRVLQTRVWSAIIQRGFGEGWNDAQFLARHVCKCIEEFSELCDVVPLPNDATLKGLVKNAGELSRYFFDEHTLWDSVDVNMSMLDIEAIGLEIADVIITMLVLAEILHIDAFWLVEQKALNDIDRGAIR